MAVDGFGRHTHLERGNASGCPSWICMALQGGKLQPVAWAGSPWWDTGSRLCNWAVGHVRDLSLHTRTHAYVGALLSQLSQLSQPQELCLLDVH